jgi:hypothetical protein
MRPPDPMGNRCSVYIIQWESSEHVEAVRSKGQFIPAGPEVEGMKLASAALNANIKAGKHPTEKKTVIHVRERLFSTCV